MSTFRKLVILHVIRIAFYDNNSFEVEKPI